MTTSSFLWLYLRRYTPWIGVACAAVIVFAAASAAMVSLVEPIFGEVLASPEPGALSVLDGEGESDSLRGAFDLKNQFSQSYASLKRRLGIDRHNVVYFVPLLFGLVFLLRAFAGFASGYSFQRVGLGMTNDIRNDLFRRIVGQSSRFHAEHSSGELVSRMINDIGVLQTAVTFQVLDLFQQSVTLLVLVALLLSTHLKLGLICLVAAPAVLYPIVRFGQSMRRTSHKTQARMADLAELVSEATRGHRVVKAFAMEQFEHDRFREATARHLRVKLRAQVLRFASGPVIETMAALGGVIFLIYAGKTIRAGELSAPLLVQFLTNLFLLYDPVRKLNRVNLIVQETLASLHRVMHLMHLPNELERHQGTRSLDGVARGIAYESVTFAYRDQPVVRGVSFEIERGEIVALVGPSGAGKSTLVGLLARFFDADEGRITIDGIDLREIESASLRRLIGLVTQETVLFSETIRNNIAYGRLDLPLEVVREAAAAAYADEFIMALPEGYETHIGEAGLQLSGGQRQRLAIARALLKNAPILILDEATSQLDSEAEALVQKALYNLMRDRTTLVIAHRLSTVVSSDRIVVLEDGRVTAAGTHDELLEVSPTYRRLYELQFDV